MARTHGVKPTIGAAVAPVLLGPISSCDAQAPTVLAVDEKVLREYAGPYQ